jgi:hypothetical protein
MSSGLAPESGHCAIRSGCLKGATSGRSQKNSLQPDDRQFLQFPNPLANPVFLPRLGLTRDRSDQLRPSSCGQQPSGFSIWTVIRHMHEDLIGTSARAIADASFLCTTPNSSPRHAAAGIPPNRGVPKHYPGAVHTVEFDCSSPNRRDRPPQPRCNGPARPAEPQAPTHQRFRLDNRHDLQDRRKPSIHLDEEPAVVICEPSPALQLSAQDYQLMSENRILRLKPVLRLEWRGQHGQNEADQRYHCANLADSVT